MQTTATRTAGSHTDLLTGILNVQVRNEDKITEQDRQYCQLQQDQLYKTLDRIDRWYAIFKEEAERYGKSRASSMRITVRSPYGISISTTAGRMTIPTTNSNRLTSSTSLRTTTAMPNANFANRIISYFNRTYNVDVPIPVIDEKPCAWDSVRSTRLTWTWSLNTSAEKVP